MVDVDTVKALCIKDWAVTAQNGDHFEVKRGEFYTTTKPEISFWAREVAVFNNTFWVCVPIDNFSFEDEDK